MRRLVLSVLLLFIPTHLYASATQELLTKAKARFAQERYDEALVAYQEFLKLDPKNPRANAGVALVFDAMGNHPEAQEHIRRAFLFSPDDAEIYFHAGLIEGSRRNFQGALEYFWKARIQNDNFPEVYFNLGVCYLHLGLLDQAEAAFNKFIDVHPGKEIVRYLWGKMEIDRRDFSKEVESCRVLLEKNPLQSKAYGALGMALEQTGPGKKGIGFLEMSVRYDPSYARGYFNLAVAHQRSGEIQKSLEFFKRAVELDGRYAAVLNHSPSRIPFDPDISCRDMSMEVRYYADFADAFYGLGRVYCLKNDSKSLHAQIEELRRLSRFDLAEDLEFCE